jgi:hypothetical protein
MNNNNLSATSHAACGFVSGITSKLVTMPFDVVKKRYQISGFPISSQHQSTNNTSSNMTGGATAAGVSSSSSRGAQPTGWWQCARTIVRNDGMHHCTLVT